MAVPPTYPQGGVNFNNITTSTTTQVKNGAGIFFGLSINTPQAGAAVTVWDGIAGAGRKIGTFSGAAQGGPQITQNGIAFATGLSIVTTGATPADVTVQYF